MHTPELLDALRSVAAALAHHRLRAVLIGNAAAILHGASVVTDDLDFLFIDTPANRKKLASVAAELGAEVTRPFFHRSLRWHLANGQRGLTLDFVLAVDGIRDARALMERAEEHDLGGVRVRVAALGDVVRSKRASGRPRDLQVLPELTALLAQRR